MSASTAWDRASELARLCRLELIAGEDWRPSALPLLDLACSAEPETASTASRALFRETVEPLADSFEPRLSELYRDLFCWLLDAVRRRAGFEALDAGLAAVGLEDADQIERSARLALQPPSPGDLASIRRILVPSRVTLGADIAVVSVVLAGLSARFPNAEAVFLAGPKNADLFSGARRLRSVTAPYPRGGSLRERLAVWPSLLQIAKAEGQDLAREELLVLDPDSRMTQLGLLPLGPAGDLRLCFDSRAFGASSNQPLAALTAGWLRDAFGSAVGHPLPWTSFKPRTDLQGQRRPLAAVSFGLGGNPDKRAGPDFEKSLIELLLDRGYRVALDRGLGPEEHDRVEPLVVMVEKAGGVVHEGSFRSFGEIVAAAELFVGYDSSFGHLAAAMGVPVVTVFAGAVSERMLHRWTPYGRAAARVVPAAQDAPADSLLTQVESALP